VATKDEMRAEIEALRKQVETQQAVIDALTARPAGGWWPVYVPLGAGQWYYNPCFGWTPPPPVQPASIPFTITCDSISHSSVSAGPGSGGSVWMGDLPASAGQPMSFESFSFSPAPGCTVSASASGAAPLQVAL
jgi:hypothetical protein